jgi:acyl carrier protein
LAALDALATEIIEIFARSFDTRLASAEVDLIEERFVDSVRLVDLVLEIEQHFGVELPFEELEIEDFRTVSRLAARITRERIAA